MLKILIADDHPMFREALRDLVAQIMTARAAEHLVIEARESAELFRAVEQDEDFDLILLDLFMPGSNGLTDLVKLRDKVPGTPIVVVSSLSDPVTVRQAVTCGAAGFVPKSTPKEQLTRALETVLAGGIYVPPEQSAPPVRDAEPLTGRQVAVLALLALGKSNKEIANQLDISEMTVKAHMTSILRKLGVSTRAQAIVAFQRASAAEHAVRSVDQDGARWRSK